jgi:hypothetical protein
LLEQAEEVRAMAAEFDAEARRRGVTALGTEIARGSTLTFELALPGLMVAEDVRKLRWRGHADSVQFEASVPADAEQRTILGKVVVAQDAVPIGHIVFKLRILAETAERASGNVPAGEARRYEKAFISYASEDRTKVQARVQMLEAAGIQYFQDLLSLGPGVRWRRRLYREIDSSDVMFLFWSAAAKASQWVEREWRYALDNKGLDFIVPVPVEGPPIPSPPAELADLQFSAKHLYFM